MDTPGQYCAGPRHGYATVNWRRYTYHRSAFGCSRNPSPFSALFCCIASAETQMAAGTCARDVWRVCDWTGTEAGDRSKTSRHLDILDAVYRGQGHPAMAAYLADADLIAG
jgi:hypothetical protein